jgi:lipopolysaccharide biosynthesis glycosyltransferase
MIKLFIGYDSSEDEAAQVCAFSVKKNASQEIKVYFIKKEEMSAIGCYYRSEDNLSSTEFTFTRFLVPYLSNYNGWSIFCDCDFLWIEDISELIKLKNDKYAVMCVQHDYKPSNNFKMDGKKQLIYPRKNWSSMVLWNCSHPANKKITLEDINKRDGKFLHRFGWLKDYEIGSIPFNWNWLVGWYKEDLLNKPKALHFTEGGPWHKNSTCTEYFSLWNEYKKELYK